MDLHRYLGQNPISQHDFFDLMEEIIIRMERKKVSVFPVTMANLKVKVDHEKKFRIRDMIKHKNTQANSEFDKIKPLLDFMIELLLHNTLNESPDNLQKIRSLPIVRELKDLIFHASSPRSILNFSLFCKKLKELCAASKNDLVLIFDQNIEEGKTLGDMPNNHQEVRDSRKRFVKCNYCGEIKLEGVFELLECGCYLHVKCLETAIINTIEMKELKGKVKYAIDCTDTKNHFHYYDILCISEVEKNGFTVSKPVLQLIQYYYLNHEISVKEKCNCNQEHPKVDKQSKSPYSLCNSKCSFCGERYHQNCPAFLKTLTWTI